jgi:hypothetical protein
MSGKKFVLFLLVFSSNILLSQQSDKVVLTGENMKQWREPIGEWLNAGDVTVGGVDLAHFSIHPGQGVFVNGENGKTNDALTISEFGDVRLHVEFMIPQGSNSGV